MSIRVDLHSKEGIELYAAGMNASFQDKAKILPFIKSGNILEIGCGNGTVLEMISNEYPDGHLFGIDMSAKLLGLAMERKYKGEVSLHCDNAFKLNTCGINGLPNRFQTIIFCSVLHEIYSGFIAQSGPDYTEFNRTMEFVRHLCDNYLEVGGRLIIRDGIPPKPEDVFLTFKDQTNETFLKFVDDFSPFKISFSYSNTEDQIKIPSRHLFEFLTKYFYESNWAIEVTEQFGWGAPEDISRNLQCGAKYKTVSSVSYTLDYLRDKWANDFALTDAHGDNYVPHSTMIYVAEKIK